MSLPHDPADLKPGRHFSQQLMPAKRLHISETEFADLLGLTPSYVRKMINQDRCPPYQVVYDKGTRSITHYFDVHETLSWLLHQLVDLRDELGDLSIFDDLDERLKTHAVTGRNVVEIVR